MGTRLTPADAASWPAHLLSGPEEARLELILAGMLPEASLFGATIPSIAPGEEASSWITLRDEEGAFLAALQVETVHSSARVVPNTITPIEGFVYHDDLDLRRPLEQIRSWIARGDGDAIGYLIDDAVHFDALRQAILNPGHAAHRVLLVVMFTRRHDGRTDQSTLLRHSRALADELRGIRGDSVLLCLLADPGEPALRRSVVEGMGVRALEAPQSTGGSDAGRATSPDAATASTSRRGGLVILFTGLSGSGKSTVAKLLRDRLVSDGRTVTTLDGDVVRRAIASELTFTAEHRAINLRRIGWVAAEIARHGGTVVAAPIAPFEESRQEIMHMVQATDSRFMLVHVSTPLEVCEARDRKGLYAAARAGSIPDFTGITSPYEAPSNAQVVIDTTATTATECVDAIMAVLGESLDRLTGDQI